MKTEAKLVAADVIRAADWLAGQTPKSGFGRFLLRLALPSACFETFEQTMKQWADLSQWDRTTLIRDLRRDIE